MSSDHNQQNSDIENDTIFDHSNNNDSYTLPNHNIDNVLAPTFSSSASSTSPPKLSSSSLSIMVPLPAPITMSSPPSDSKQRSTYHNNNNDNSSTTSLVSSLSSPMSNRTNNNNVNNKSMSVLSLSSSIQSISSQATPKVSNQQNNKKYISSKTNQSSSIPRNIQQLPKSILTLSSPLPSTSSDFTPSAIGIDNGSSPAVISQSIKSPLPQPPPPPHPQLLPTTSSPLIATHPKTGTETNTNGIVPSSTNWINDVEIQPHDLLHSTTTISTTANQNSNDINNTSTTSATSDWLNTMMYEMETNNCNEYEYSVLDDGQHQIQQQQQVIIPTKPTQLDLIDTYLQIQHHQQNQNRHQQQQQQQQQQQPEQKQKQKQQQQELQQQQLYNQIEKCDESFHPIDTPTSNSCTRVSPFPYRIFETTIGKTTKNTTSSSQAETATTTSSESNSNDNQVEKTTNNINNNLYNDESRFAYRIVTIDDTTGQIYDETDEAGYGNKRNEIDNAEDNPNDDDEEEDDDEDTRTLNRKRLQYIMENGGGLRCSINSGNSNSIGHRRISQVSNNTKPKVYCSSEEFYDDDDDDDITRRKSKKCYKNNIIDDQLVVAQLVIESSQDFMFNNNDKYLPSAIMYDPEKEMTYQNTKRKSNRCRVILILFSILIVTSIIIGVVVSRTNTRRRRQNNNNNNNNEIANNLLNHPRLYIGIQEMIVQNIPTNNVTIDMILSSVSSISSMTDVVSLLLTSSSLDPYIKAFYWITFLDEQQLVPQYNSTFLQRYLLASIYYSTSRDNDWEYCNPRINSNTTFTTINIQNVTTTTTTTTTEATTPTTLLRNTKCQVCLWTKLHGGMHDPERRPLGSWLSSKDECKWAGIYCDKHGHIIMINTIGFGQSGLFPDQTTLYPFLQYITFGHGNISGSLPNNIWYKYLIEFVVPDHKLTGTVPSSLIQQSRILQNIQLAYNQFTNINIQQISSDIKRIGFDSMQSTYVEPHTIGTSNNLHSNNSSTTRSNKNSINNNIHRTISDIDIQHLHSISSFDMANNLLYGTIPSKLLTLPYITDIDIIGNNLYGTIPTIMNVPNLGRFLVEKNKLTGTIPIALYQQKMIDVIRLGNNQLNGTISTMISKLYHLVVLSLDNNNMTGTIPISIGTLSELSDFSIIGNAFNGTIPIDLCDSTMISTIAADCQGTMPEISCPIDCCTTCCTPNGLNCLKM